MLENPLARRVVLAIRSRLIELEEAPDTNLGDIGWLRDRCEDTLGLRGAPDWWCSSSLRQLKKDTTKFTAEAPGLLAQDLLDALESLPTPQHGYMMQRADVPALKDPSVRRIVEALRSRVIEWKESPEISLENKDSDIRVWLLRCEELLRAGDDVWCKLSLAQLKKDVAQLNDDEPGLLDPVLVESLQNVPETD